MIIYCGPRYTQSYRHQPRGLLIQGPGLLAQRCKLSPVKNSAGTGGQRLPISGYLLLHPKVNSQKAYVARCMSMGYRLFHSPNKTTSWQLTLSTEVAPIVLSLLSWRLCGFAMFWNNNVIFWWFCNRDLKNVVIQPCHVRQLKFFLSGEPDYFGRNKILSGYDLSHYQVPHCIRVFFDFVWFVFIHHNFQFYFKLCTYCNISDIYLS